jgi:hypothetical protein
MREKNVMFCVIVLNLLDGIVTDKLEVLIEDETNSINTF